MSPDPSALPIVDPTPPMEPLPRPSWEERQAAATVSIDGFLVRPASRTKAGHAVGWELVPPPGHGPVWYLRDRAEAIAAVERHRRAYLK